MLLQRNHRIWLFAFDEAEPESSHPSARHDMEISLSVSFQWARVSLHCHVPGAKMGTQQTVQLEE